MVPRSRRVAGRTQFRKLKTVLPGTLRGEDGPVVFSPVWRIPGSGLTRNFPGCARGAEDLLWSRNSRLSRGQIDGCQAKYLFGTFMVFSDQLWKQGNAVRPFEACSEAGIEAEGPADAFGPDFQAG